MKTCDWFKNNKLTVFLLIIIGFLFFKGGLNKLAIKKSYAPREMASLKGPIGKGIIPPQVSQTAPRPEIEERMVVQESNISLLVENVQQKVDEIINYAESKNGYMVSSSLKRPEEAPFATVVLRVPSKELKSTLTHFRNLAIRVTSENLLGRDVTDQYFDLEARLETLEKTKVKFEEILIKAVKVDEILRVEREIINIQEQIDRFKGRQKYLEKTAENAKLTVYLSSDEWALPYAPAKPFRAKVIFKTAVRSLILSFRGLAKLAIWVGVYSIIWLPVMIVFLVFKKRGKQ